MPARNPLSEVTTVDVANAVASEINSPVTGTVWSQSGFTCVRKWMPFYKESELATLQLCVTVASEDDERISRKHVQREHLVKLWLQKKVGPEPERYETQIDALAAFAFQIKDYWMTAYRVLAALPNVNPLRAKVMPYSPKDLEERQLYAGVVELTFREVTQQ